MLALLMALSAQTATAPKFKHDREWRVSPQAEVYPGLQNTPIMEIMRGYCIRYDSAKTAKKKQFYAHALRATRNAYMGDLSQNIYQCMKHTRSL